MGTKTHFTPGKGGHRGPAPHGRPGSKGKKPGQRRSDGSRPRSEPLIEQPLSDTSGTVLCPICGNAVDPQRMHPHMVRFHGVAIRSKGAWAGQSDSTTGKEG